MYQTNLVRAFTSTVCADCGDGLMGIDAENTLKMTGSGQVVGSKVAPRFDRC